VSVIGFLEREIIGLQSERIVRKIKRGVLIAAERQLADRILLTLGQIGNELDLACGQHPSRGGDNRGSGPDHAFRRVDFDPQAAGPFDAPRRCCQLDLKAAGELR
jgi:hypothetical protein